ncbi:MAG TPA: DUF6599 family protein [Terriglobales bacterium]|nr:DUF6599 family protein [Terriglobales bacterium]
MKPFYLVFAFFMLSVCASAAPEPSILPKSFSAWQMSGNAKRGGDPAAADGINAALLKEYGFQDLESATYVRDDGRKLTVKAARFNDASGAYGAFTFYREPQMNKEEIGDKGASANERILFYRGNVLVDAVFSRLSAMSAAELRELANALPLPPGNARALPNLLSYLPRQSFVANSTKYVLGPIALRAIHAPIPETLINFNAGAEVIQGTYNSSGGEATLMLIGYPTPQIAAEQLKRLDAAHQANTTQQAGSPTLVDVGPFFDRRTGPIVVVAAGPLSQSEARSLLASVNYDADVTWNENTSFSKKDNLANLLVNIIILCGIICGFALVAGIAFGGLRVLFQRILPERVFDRPEQVEFISLHLSEGGPGGEPTASGRG